MFGAEELSLATGPGTNNTKPASLKEHAMGDKGGKKDKEKLKKQKERKKKEEEKRKKKKQEKTAAPG